MGAVLSQVQDGLEKVVCYFSKTFSRSERSYCVTRRELLGVVASIKHFHHYLYGKHFKVRSDHGALSWLLNFKNPEGQLARWFEVLASYDFRIEHRAGRSHNNADALSRRPCYNYSTECAHCTRAEKNFESGSEQFLLDNKEISISKVENWNDKNTVGESFRNVQDDSSSQKSAFKHIENLFDPNLCVKQCMTSDSCRKVQEGYEVNVDHKETLRTKIENQILTDNEIKHSVITSHHSEMIRVCTRSRDYSSRQNETFDKDNPEKEIDTDNLRELQLQDDTINIVLLCGKKETCMVIYISYES